MDYRVHGVALIGVRGALGVDSATGSPFNVQQSVHVPNLQAVEPAVVERVYRETRGQPGRANREWLLRDAPRRRDLRVFEAVHHFVLYSFLDRFLQPRGGRVYPEFPAGNGAIDLLIRYAGNVYGLEVKSFTDAFGYRPALGQAARYARQLGLDRVTLVFFVDAVDDANRDAYEAVTSTRRG